MYFIQHWMLHAPPLRVSEDAGIESRTAATSALALVLTTRQDLIHTGLDIIHTRLYLIHNWLDLIHTGLDIIHTRLDLIHNWLDLIHD